MSPLRNLLVPAVLGTACARPTAPSPPFVAEVTEPEWSGPTLASLDFPGDPILAAAARDTLALLLVLHPERAADAGLLADGLHLPSFSPDALADHLSALDTLAERLAEFDENSLSTADHIDLLLLRTEVATARHQLTIERRFTHRPAEWLEPVSSLLAAHLAASEPHPAAVDRLVRQLPAMFDEMRQVVTDPTRRDVDTAHGLLQAIDNMLSARPPTPAISEAIAALRAYKAALPSTDTLPEMRMIGGDAYRWRLEHALLLPWDAETLLAHAEADLAVVDAELARLQDQRTPRPPPTEAEVARGRELDAQGFLDLHDEMVARYLDRLRAMDVLTVPDDLPPLRARPTPDALIPLTGDGGSMNPVPAFGPESNRRAWWNVEHFRPGSDPDQHIGTVVTMARSDESWFGPYAVHEGVPGHHLQLSIVRELPRPVRRLAHSGPGVEGWALYAEALFEENGGFGGTVEGRIHTLRSYRARIKRVVFDVKVETGEWTLQQAADWKHDQPEGQGHVDPELLRTVQWPTQLIGYYAGREEIEAIKARCREHLADAWSEREFHDKLLAQGPIPVSLAGLALDCE